MNSNFRNSFLCKSLTLNLKLPKFQKFKLQTQVLLQLQISNLWISKPPTLSLPFSPISFFPPGSARARASPASGHVLASPRRRLAVPSRLPRRRSACCASAPSAHHHASTPSPAPSHPLANPTFPGAAARATGSAPLPAPTRPLCATEPPQRPLPPPLGYLSKPKPSSPHLSPLLPLCR